MGLCECLDPGDEHDDDNDTLDDRKEKALWKAAGGMLAGFLLEIVVACLFSAVLPRSYGIIAWVSLGIGLFIIRIPFAVIYLKWDHKFNTKVVKLLIVVAVALPSALFLSMSTWGVIKDCTFDMETKTVRSYTREAVGTYGEAEITCYNEATPTLFGLEHHSFLSEYLTSMFPSVIQIALPLVFAFIITDGLGSMLMLSFAESKSAKVTKTFVTLLQLAVLDFADVSGFASLSWDVSAQVYFSNLNLWFWVNLSLLVVGYFATWAEVIYLIMNAEGISEDVDDEDEECVFSSISMLINVPLGVFRCYMLFCHVRIDKLYLVKNIFCGLYEFSTITKCVCLKHILERLLNFLPGGGDMAEKAKGAKKEKALEDAKGEAREARRYRRFEDEQGSNDDEDESDADAEEDSDLA